MGSAPTNDNRCFVLLACIIFLLSSTICYQSRTIAALQLERVASESALKREIVAAKSALEQDRQAAVEKAAAGRRRRLQARVHRAQPATRLPWGSADRDSALHALKRRHQALATGLRNAHCCPAATSFDTSYIDHGYAWNTGPCRRRDASCVATHGSSADAITSHIAPNSSLAPFRSTMLSVNGRFLALDDILFGYEILQEVQGFESRAHLRFVLIRLTGLSLASPSPAPAFARTVLWHVLDDELPGRRFAAKSARRLCHR
jgi:hypothetical protein